jgi:hypothetical protein
MSWVQISGTKSYPSEALIVKKHGAILKNYFMSLSDFSTDNWRVEWKWNKYSRMQKVIFFFWK